MTVHELRRRLAGSDEERTYLLGKILREAREPDVWLFTTPEEVSARWNDLQRHLGRRRDFWSFLLQQWRELGLLSDKITIDGIVVDPPEEILANKLCTLLSRTEVRDLVDVKTLEAAGYDPLEALPLAEKKDGGVTASQLAWILSTFPIPGNDAELHGVSRDELQEYRDSLRKRLAAVAYPRG